MVYLLRIAKCKFRAPTWFRLGPVRNDRSIDTRFVSQSFRVASSPPPRCASISWFVTPQKTRTYTRESVAAAPINYHNAQGEGAVVRAKSAAAPILRRFSVAGYRGMHRDMRIITLITASCSSCYRWTVTLRDRFPAEKNAYAACLIAPDRNMY